MRIAGTVRLIGRRRRFRRLVAALTLACGLVAAVPLVGDASSGGYDPSIDPYSMASLDAQIGASAWWDAGYTGAGIDVAVIDTGVTPVPALSTPGKVVYGPDLSLDSQSPSLRNLDSYGHGTFMAGLIAGHDPSLASPYSQASASVYRGVAPDARIVSIKVGAADGEVDVSQVIAAIDWVVQHARDPGFNIRVINLSYGTNSRQPYQDDPLAYAAEQAWKHGIVVVAAAGNTGFQRGYGASGLADPAYDPYIIGVGGVDTNGQASDRGWEIASYSVNGCDDHSCKDPDFVAPGSHLQGLRVPGSFIDLSTSGGILSDQYMRGSGTSEAAAIASGAIALILQRFPTLTPDGVKAYIEADATKLHKVKDTAQGSGALSLTAMLSDAPQGYRKPEPTGTAPSQRYPDSDGGGSLEAARGTDHISLNGVTLTGEIDIFGKPFDSGQIAQAEAAGSSWSGGSWNGSTWSGSSWSGSSWSGSSWSGATWSGSSWSGSSWSGSSWSGSTWSGISWSGNGWSSSTWG
jgi:serine protease AprX